MEHGQELPQGWGEVELVELFDFVIGGDWGKEPEFNDPEYGFAYCIRGAEFKNWKNDKGSTASLRKVKLKNIASRKLEFGDILVEISGGGPEQPVGRTVLIDQQALSLSPQIPKICTNFLRMCRSSKHINSNLLQIYLTFFYKSGEVVKYQGGSNNLRNLKFEDYSKILIPLPPLQEQHRIVAKIESLFSILDQSVASLKKAQQQLKTYRQAVLKWAFEGKLTGEVMGDDGDLPLGWGWVKMGDIFEVFVGSTPSRKVDSYWNGDINWVSSGEVAFNKIFSTKEKISKNGLQNSSCKLHPPGTVIMAMIGEGKTRCQVAVLENDATHNQNTAAIRLDKCDYLPNLLYFYLFFTYEKNRGIGSGNNQKALNKERVKNIEVLQIPLPTQQKIVAAIESRLSVCDKLEEQIGQSLQKAEALRQSILKKAFLGQLVPQDPADEPAERLLERIRAERAADIAGVKKTRKKQ
jgi:type I restriction enzyme S subunit